MQFVPAELRRHRARLALSQQELADKARLARSTILKIETGKEHPRPSTIRKLAKALGIDPHELQAEP